jgi:hypothetical protein
MLVEDLLARLDGVVRNGRGWAARCPAHEDRNPSLSIGVGDDERILVHCHAGCEVEQICAALGLQVKDFFNDEPPSDNGRRQSRPRIVAEYRYFDADGTFVYKIVRRHPKDFRISPAGFPADRRVLYNLPAVLAAAARGEAVYKTAGEKDADVLIGDGLVATTNPFGEGPGHWLPQYSEALTGATVIFCRDRDETGRAHAREVVPLLLERRCDVTVVEAAVGKDIAEHYAAGLKAEDLVIVDVDEADHEAGSRASGGGRKGEREESEESFDVPRVPFPALNPAALYGPLGEMVELFAPHSEAHPAALLSAGMVLAGVSIGRHARYVINGVEHHANLFVAVVGRTAKARKSQGLAEARWAMRWADADLAERIYSGFGSGESFVDEVADPVYDDDGKLTFGSVDRRLVVVEHELAGIFAVAHREGTTYSPKLRDAWDGWTLRAISRRRKVKATDAHVGLIGAITLRELVQSLTTTDAANGLGNRFLFVGAQRSQLLPFGGSITDDEIAVLGLHLGQALDRARKVGVMHFATETRDRWIDLYNAMATADDGDDLVSALTARAEAQVLRLALLYAALDGDALIGLRHLEAAWAMWCYSRESVRWIFGHAPLSRDSERFFQAVTQAGPDGLGREESRQEVFGHNVSAERIDAAVDPLLERGLVFARKVSTAGRPALVYVLAEWVDG